MSEAISKELEAKGFAIESKLVRDDFNGREGANIWSVTILRNGQEFTTEYTQGCGDRHYKGGKAFDPPYGRLTVHDAAMNKMRTIPNSPVLADVMCSLVWDAQSVADGQTFEDFAGDMGYDTDSRQAEKCYNGCRDEYFGLLRLCGAMDLDVLSQMFQDY